MELRRFCNAICRKLWLVVIFGIIGGGASFYVNYYNNVPIYEAVTTIFTVTSKTNTPNTTNDDNRIRSEDILIGRQFGQDFQDIMMSENVMTNAENKLKSQNISAEDLAGMVSLSLQKESNIIRILACSDNPEKSVLISQAVSSAFIDKLQEITKTNIVGVIDEAKKPLEPVQVNYVKGTIIGVLAGIIMAFLIIYILELFDSRVRSAEDIEYNLMLPVLAQIPKH